MTNKFSRQILSILITTTIITGCTTLNSALNLEEESIQAPPEHLAVEKISLDGMEAYNKGKYFTALNLFTEITTKHPFSKEAALAELKVADSNFHMGNYQIARKLYKKFEADHPTNEVIPYIMFQIGMCSYKKIGRIDRDTSGATETISDFSRLLRFFPNSPYSPEAKSRIKAANNFLANHEYKVAIFYIRGKRLEEASKRLQYLLERYPEAKIAKKAAEMLQKIDSKDTPELGIKSLIPNWTLPSFSVPDWRIF